MRQGEIMQLGTPSEILRAPADDYVAQFVEDISLVRAIHAVDLLVPAGIDCGARTATVTPQATVEDMLSALARGTTGFSVAGEDGKVLGVIVPEAVLAVLDRDRERRH
jgi:glycine betaine/proline transport system ATP-binding protein